MPVPPVIAMAPNAWEGQWMNRQQLLSRLAARGVRVVYSAGQWYSWQRHSTQWRQAPHFGRFERRDGVIVDQPPKWLVRTPTLPVLDRLSTRFAARRLLHEARGNGSSSVIAYLFHPSFQPYVRHFANALLVYHAYDLFESMPSWSDTDRKQEEWLLARADLVIASSEEIARRLSERSGRLVRALHNAVDTAAFGEAIGAAPPPEDLRAVPTPRIGYVGSINRKVDLPLLEALALARPEWHFVLIGPVGSLDHATSDALERCRRLQNVHLLGAKPHWQLPAYVANLDLALMPYRKGAGLWTEAIYPLKLHEYLAADRPTVSTYLPSLKPFASVLAFAASRDEWIAAIEDGLNTGGVGEGLRRAVAGRNDWEARVNSLLDWLAESGTGALSHDSLSA